MHIPTKLHDTVKHTGGVADHKHALPSDDSPEALALRDFG